MQRSLFSRFHKAIGAARLGFTAIQGLLAGAINRIEELYESGTALTGVSTGFADLDDLTSGLQRSDLIVIAGRPSMGKTSLAMNIVESVVLDSKFAGSGL